MTAALCQTDPQAPIADTRVEEVVSSDRVHNVRVSSRVALSVAVFVMVIGACSSNGRSSTAQSSASSNSQSGRRPAPLATTGTSRERPTVVVPDLANVTVPAAGAALSSRHLRVSVVRSFCRSVSPGRVVRTRPRSGSHAQIGSTVLLVVSLGAVADRLAPEAGTAQSSG